MSADLTWTWYRHRTSTRGLRLVLDRDELRHALADAAPAASKDDLPLVCPATYADDRRGNERVERVYLLGLDIDDPTSDPPATMRAISEALGDVETYVYSTYSSQPGAYRLRALVPYDAPATGEQHRASWSLVARVLARAGVIVDRACSDPARGYYVWSIPPSGAYYSGHIDGEPWPAARAAEAEIARRAAEQHRPQLRVSQRGDLVSRARSYVARMPPAISGSRGHDTLWAVARVLVADYGLDDTDAMDLLREYSARCQPPWSDRDLRHKMQSARTARVHRDMEAPR